MNYKYEIVNYDKNIPAKILYCDLSSDTHKTELHWHREPEIVYVLDGLGECSHNGEVMDLPAGECKIFNSEDVHLVRPKMGHHANMIIIQLSFEYMRMFCKTIDSVIFDLHERSEQKGEICEILRQIASIDIDHDEYGVLKQIQELIYYTTNCLNIVLHLREVPILSLYRSVIFICKTAIAYINENFKQEIPLNEISSVVNLSPSYFSKYFKSVTQVSFSEYLANLRLENALQDMLTKNSTVTVAAVENGFANVKSFITQCKKVYGYTPAQYKKHLLNR